MAESASFSGMMQMVGRPREALAEPLPMGALASALVHGLALAIILLGLPSLGGGDSIDPLADAISVEVVAESPEPEGAKAGGDLIGNAAKPRYKVSEPVPDAGAEAVSEEVVETAVAIAPKVQHRPRTKPVNIPARAGTPGPAGADATVMEDYLARVQNWLRSHRRYPESARRRGLEGRVLVRFVVNRQGRVLAYHIVKGSGIKAFDQEARRLMRAASPVPAIPAELTQRQMAMAFALEFIVPR